VERTSISPEELKETFRAIKEVDDKLIKLFLECWETQPQLDHVTANKRIKSQGTLLRIIERLNQLVPGRSKNPQTNYNNIFAPTGALKLFQ